MTNTRISVIIPMYNASGHIEECLDAISRQVPQDFEVILVDDCSTDDSVRKAAKYPFRLVELSSRVTPSAVRNRGAAAASGGVLVFVDADVVLQPDSVRRIVDAVSAPGVDAVSGIYTEETPQKNFYSRFQNSILVYRYRKMPAAAAITSSFFSAIKRDAFEAISGYDENMHYYEDVEIGNRLAKKGFGCRFDPDIRVTHLKYYNHLSLIADYFRKAAAAGLYIKRQGFGVMTKNGWPLALKASSVSAVLVIASLFFVGINAVPFFSLLAAHTMLSGSLLRYLLKTKSPLFCLKSYLFLFEIFLASSAGLCYGALRRARYD